MDQIRDGRSHIEPFTTTHPRGTKRNDYAGEQ